MIFRYITLTIFIISQISVLAQEYVIFEDNFNDNLHNWPIQDNENVYMKVLGNRYVIEQKQAEKSWVSWVKVVIDTKKDFSISCNTLWVSGIDNNGYNVCWGLLDANNFYYFGVSANGYYQSGAFISGTYKELIKWTESEFIKKNGSNKIELKRKGSTIEFYINDHRVNQSNFDDFFGDNIGFYISNKQKILFDNLRVAYIEEQKMGNSVKNETNDSFIASLPPILSIKDISFSKNQLNANETAQLSITLKNIGSGDANGVYVNLSSDLAGLQFSPKTNFPVITKNGGVQTVNIDIKGGLDLPTAEAVLKIEIVEPNFKVKIQGKQVKIPTREFSKPELILAKFGVVENLSANPNEKIDINDQIDVKLAIQNIGQGNAENVNITATNNQSGLMLIGFVDNAGNLVRKNPSFNLIPSGKYETIIYRYFVNSEFTSNQLTFTISTTEKHGKYGFTQTKSVEINKELKEEGYIRNIASIGENENKVIIEDSPNFVSDIDQNIPANPIVNNKTFAIVIGNEVYAKEIKVKFALNDARIFKQYLQKTLGIPNNNIHYTENATFGQILDALKWINDVIKAYNGKAKVVFYYAGHGVPDVQTKSAYLLPVDGNSQNTLTAVKLADVYEHLTESPSISVTVFLDACFSGAAREQNGMLVNGRGVKIKPKNDLLKGNLVVFSATTGDETAFPFIENQHGMFSYFLLKKIQETKGNVTLNDLGNYVITNVTQQSVVVNKKSQTPQVNISPLFYGNWQTMMLK